MVKITVNGREVEADPKKPLIAACHSHDVEVPHYCYHPGLTPVGSCRICQVEVQQGQTPGRVMVACRTYPAEGMVVNTESDKAHATRRECLEFLLKNHPLDCPICDKAGECDLQDYTYSEGQAKGRTHEPRRKLEKRKSLGEVIVLDEERCILCSRCVRFFEEVPKQAQLTVSQLGSRSVIETFAEKPLKGNYQGNIADLCPVGALTLKEFRFQARVWNLVKMASTCPECSRGCSIQVEVLRNGEVKRFRPRENQAVNGWWMCDTGRFAFEHVNATQRLAGALVRERERDHATGALVRERDRASDARARGEWRPIEVDSALELAHERLTQQREVLILASPFCTLEEGEKLRELARSRGTTPAFVSPGPNGLADKLLHTGDPAPNRRGLTELGFEALEPKEALRRLSLARVALLVGERVCELVGTDALHSLPSGPAGVELIVLDTHALDASACTLCIGVPTWVERTGTYVNVDGQRGPISAARSAPAQVRPTTRLLQALGARREEVRSR